MTVVEEVNLEQLLDKYFERANREFQEAWSKITHPSVRQRRQFILEDLNRYYKDLPKDVQIRDYGLVAENLAIALEELLPLLLVLRVETDVLLANPSIAYATPNGSLTFCWSPFFVSNWKDSPVSSVKPDEGDDSGLGRLVYIWNDNEFFEQCDREKLLKDVSSGHANDLKRAELLEWPDDEPMFDAAYLAAIAIHEACHIGLGHFLPILYEGLPDRVVRYMHRTKPFLSRRSVKRLIDKLGEDNALKIISKSVVNVLLDASIHTIVPSIVGILDVAAKKRLPFGGGGSCNNPGRGQQSGDDEDTESAGCSGDQEDGATGSDVSDASRTSRGQSIDDILGGGGDDDQDDGSDGEPSDNAGQGKSYRKVHQRGEPVARRIARDPSSVEQVAKSLKETAKRIGSETGMLSAVEALLAKLKRDPFMRLQSHRASFRSLFGSPKQRVMQPRADEVYLRRRGLIRYLPRFTREPIVQELTVVVDTSGSMSDDEIGKALGVLRQLAGKNYLFNVIVCDTQPIVVGRRMAKLPDRVECPRGGTSLGEGVRQAKELGMPIENVVYITDGYNCDWAADVKGMRRVCVILTVPKDDKNAEGYVDNFKKQVSESFDGTPPEIHVVYMEDVLEKD